MNRRFGFVMFIPCWLLVGEKIGTGRAGVPSGNIVIKTLKFWSLFIRFLKMPFSGKEGGVTALFHRFGNGQLGRLHIVGGTGNAGACRKAAGQKRVAGGNTARMG